MIGRRYDGIGLPFLLRRRREDSDIDVQDLIPLIETALAASLPRRLKSRPAVYTRARMRTARANAQRYGWAREWAEGRIAAAAAPIARPLQELAQEMPPPNLERGWNNVCPHCDWWGHGLPGDMDIAAHPWEVGCPGCGQRIPGFDARAWLRSGRDARGWFWEDGADDDLLPRDPARRQRAVDAVKAYSYHYWHWGFTPTLDALADAYWLTGETRYARHGVGLLAHLARFFPYYCKKDIVNGDTHPGELIMDCYEAMLMKSVALAYDKLFLAIDDAEVRAAAEGLVADDGVSFATGDALRAYVEGRIFQTVSQDMVRIWFMDGGTARYRDHMAYETIGLVLGDTSLGKAFLREARRLRFQGFEADGSATVGGVGYDKTAFHHVVEQHLDLVKYCADPPVDYLADPSVQAAAHHWLDLYCLDRYFPNYGDAGYCAAPANFTVGGLRPYDAAELGQDRTLTACRYAELFAATGEKRFAAAALSLAEGRVEDLHLGILDRQPEKVQVRVAKAASAASASLERSSLATDIGLAVLKSGTGDDRRALWLRGNRRNQVSEAGWHGHADSMNLGLFGFGLDLLPDVGYMDQKHWVFGHNTVCRQDTPLPGTGDPQPDLSCRNLPLPILSEARQIGDLGPGVQFARCDAVDAAQGWRVSLLVDAGGGAFYVLDHIHVGAAVPERYVTCSFHTQQGRVTTPLRFADHDTHLEGESRMSGRWLTPTRAADPAQLTAPWHATVAVADTYGVRPDRCDVKLRFTCLRPLDHLFHTWYRPQQKFAGNPERLPYFLLSLRHRGDEPRRFTSLIEPYRGRRCVTSARVVPDDEPGVETVDVRERSGRRLRVAWHPEGPQVTVA